MTDKTQALGSLMATLKDSYPLGAYLSPAIEDSVKDNLLDSYYFSNVIGSPSLSGSTLFQLEQYDQKLKSVS